MHLREHLVEKIGQERYCSRGKVNALENQDLSHSHDVPKHDHEVGKHEHEAHGHTKILVNEKTIQILQNQIDELKAKSDNPLAQ